MSYFPVKVCISRPFGFPEKNRERECLVSPGNNSPVAPRRRDRRSRTRSKLRDARFSVGRFREDSTPDALPHYARPQLKMVDAYSPNFSLDGLGLDLSAVGRYDLCPRSGARRRAPSLSPSRAKARASSFFRRSVWESRPPRAPRARRAPPLTARSLDFLDTQVTLIGGLDSLIHNDHWRCVAPPRPRPSP